MPVVSNAPPITQRSTETRGSSTIKPTMSAQDVMAARCLSRTTAVTTALTSTTTRMAIVIGRISQAGCDATDAPRIRIAATGVAMG